MKSNLSGLLETEQTMIKTAFLSYYISMYNAVNREIGYEDEYITVDEIYDFIQDLKHEGGKRIPQIQKQDISYCLRVLQLSGICR